MERGHEDRDGGRKARAQTLVLSLKQEGEQKVCKIANNRD